MRWYLRKALAVTAFVAMMALAGNYGFWTGFDLGFVSGAVQAIQAIQHAQPQHAVPHAPGVRVTPI